MTTQKTNIIPDDTIDIKSDRDHVRLRKGMYLPNKNYCESELIDNSVDEHLNGFGNYIYFELNNEGQITVADNGRGLRVDPSPKMPEFAQAELAFSRLQAGSKFDGQVKSAGLNGVGSSCVNFLSEYFDVTIDRDGKKHHMRFEKGILVEKLHTIGDSDRTGTKIVCKPDEELWKDDDDYDLKDMVNRIKQICYLNPKLTIEINIDYNGVQIKEKCNYPEGVKTYLEELCKNFECLHEPWYFSTSVMLPGDVPCDISSALVYTSSYSDTLYAFTNNVINSDPKSSNITGFKKGVANAIKYVYETENPKSKLKIKPDDTREGIVSIISVKLTDPNYIGQGKNYLNMPKVAKAVSDNIKEFIIDQLDKFPNEKDSIFSKIEQSCKVREAAHRARETARKAKNSIKRAEKLAKCTCTDPEKCELFLVEGDSAAGTAKNAREDSKTMAILPVFGKIPNAEDLTLANVLASDKLRDIISTLECGIGEDFDIDKLRYHKIIILADADVDGYHIATLYLTFFWRFMKPLLENGYVYLSCPPLYKIVVNPKSKTNKEVRYAITDKDLEEILNDIGDKPYEVLYIKGLGEMTDEQLWESTMNPETRTLIQVSVDDIEDAEDTIIKCMNKNAVSQRKELIMNDEYLDVI